MELEAIYNSDDYDSEVSGPRTQSHCRGEGKLEKLRGSRCVLLVLVILGFICALLLLFITLQHISITAERDLLKTYKNTVEELNHTISSLQHNNTDLKTDKHQLEDKINDLSAQKKQLQNNFNSLNQKKLELENRVTSLNDELIEASKNETLCGLDRLFFSDEAKSWSQSRQFCRDRGADLVIIKSEKKQKIVSLLVNERVWIGLSDIESEGNLTWVDNSTLNQGFWRKGEPNDEHGIEDCVEIMGSHGFSALNNWNDLPCSQKRKAICEK
ncbi:CD209 antigen-like protein B [Danio aesculapii]|uniref:CD209 antigen-like protein B n=1 Tax=Danio aesculapii TaxID=1142201 RepID=UPI0024C03E42|nr:CD209 antigen-like protein B [Danio aesculapii]